MSETDVRPMAMMKFVDRHNQRFASMSKAARRIKIDLNHTWRIRLLPVQMGRDKEPFVDIAEHWWNKSPITCPINTSESWGGSPDHYCPICEISERLRNSSDDDINSIGYRARCNLKIRAWCIVLDIEDNHSNIEDVPISEVLKPYEFDMFKTTWEQFSKYQKWSMGRMRRGQEPSEYGLLDLETGADLLATQTAKGVALDRCDPGPIFDLKDPNYDNYIQKIWTHINQPRIIIPTEKQLIEVAAKIEEYAETGGRGGSSGRGGRNGGGRGGRGRSSEQEEENDRGRGRGNRRSRDEGEDSVQGDSRRSRFREDSEDDAPSGRRSSRQENYQQEPPPSSRRRQEQEPPQQEPEPESPTPPPRRSQSQAQNGTSAPPARRPQEEAAEQQEPEQQEPEQQEPENTQEQEPSAPPPARRARTTNEAPSEQPAPPPPPRRSAPSAPAAPPPQSRRNDNQDGDLGPQKPPARRAAPTQAGVDEEEDNVPEERRDPAPVERNERVEEPPPPVGATGPAPSRAPAADGGDLKNRLQRLNQRRA